MLLVWKARRDIQIAGTRAQAQAAIGGDKAIEAFSEFRDLVTRAEIADRSGKMKEQMKELEKVKEIRFSPINKVEKTIQLPTYKKEDFFPPKELLKPAIGPIKRAAPPKLRR